MEGDQEGGKGEPEIFYFPRRVQHRTEKQKIHPTQFGSETSAIFEKEVNVNQNKIRILG